MGPFRRGLILSLLPGPALAEVCDKERPSWDGVPEDGLGEAIALFSTLPSLSLLLVTALVIRFRSKWGAVATTVLWTGLVSVLALVAPNELRQLAISEGCIGSPTLFIAVVAAICVAMILYTAPRTERTG